MSRVLLVDDDVELCEMLVEYLAPEGFAVDVAHDGESGMQLALSGRYDVVVLDIMLPGINGLEVLRRIRTASQTPVLMLTARGEDVDRIIGLEMGSDDYLAKPCNPRELVARLRAILRRSQQARIATTERTHEILCVGDLEVHPASRRVVRSGETLELTSTEYNLLEVLVRNVGQVVTKEDLSQEALGRKLARYDRSIDMHVSKLRRKLGLSPDGQPLIQTVRGIGYQFTGED